ncbi:MAG: hypothetical protein HOE19_02810 [Candidatus Komeilibacteria bacterium]|jgi:hypothetical protein|nr:hypothetical protein [Candidatus Komeilibacteria bacterium]MBT4447263.1 hypothetical protein [Candidatus Komeilibacteria bacterium]
MRRFVALVAVLMIGVLFAPPPIGATDYFCYTATTISATTTIDTDATGGVVQMNSANYIDTAGGIVDAIPEHLVTTNRWSAQKGNFNVGVHPNGPMATGMDYNYSFPKNTGALTTTGGYSDNGTTFGAATHITHSTIMQC